MANRVRGIRQSLPANVLLGRLNGSGGPAIALSTINVANALIQGGAIPLPGGGGFITAVDSNFTVTGGTLSLHTIVAGNIIANSTGSTAEPTTTTLTALLDQALGNTEGQILQRGASVWQVLAPGTSGQVLTSGGASALNAWAAASGGTTLNNRGAWNGFVGYNPGDVVTYNGSAYLDYVAITAPSATPQQWVNNVAMTITTTNTTNDTGNSTVGGGGNALCLGNLSEASGLWYFEFEATGWVDNGTQVGVITAGGFSGQNFGAQFGGSIQGNASGSGTGSYAGIQNSKRGAVAINLTTNKFFVCEDVTAGSPNWNGSSSNSPVTGTGGVSMGAMGGAVFPYFYAQSSANQFTVLFTAAASFLGSIPGGYSPWSTPSASTTSPDLDDGHWLSQGAVVVGTTEVGGGTTNRLLYDNAGVVGEAIVGSGLSLSGGTLTASGGSGLTVGTTTIASGTTTRVLYDNAGVLGEYTITGSGNVVMSTSPTLVTPALGTPSALVLTNATALPAAQVASGALVNGMTATTQTTGDNTTKIATDAFVNASITAAGSPSTVGPTLQIFTSGSGTYTTPAGVVWIEVQLVGGGSGGGGGFGGGNGTNSSAGGDTTFGTTFLKGGGGTATTTAGGQPGTGPGQGGTATGGDVNIAGGSGDTNGVGVSGVSSVGGGGGAVSYFGGAGGGASGGANTGGAASANSGSGGGGAGIGAISAQAPAGGGAGGYVQKLIVTPSSTYAYAVGASGAGGVANGTGGAAGGAGGSGIIIVIEHYNH